MGPKLKAKHRYKRPTGTSKNAVAQSTKSENQQETSTMETQDTKEKEYKPSKEELERMTQQFLQSMGAKVVSEADESGHCIINFGGNPTVQCEKAHFTTATCMASGHHHMKVFSTDALEKDPMSCFATLNTSLSCNAPGNFFHVSLVRLFICSCKILLMMNT